VAEAKESDRLLVVKSGQPLEIFHHARSTKRDRNGASGGAGRDWTHVDEIQLSPTCQLFGARSEMLSRIAEAALKNRHKHFCH
jgi:hypothetical protein